MNNTYFFIPKSLAINRNRIIVRVWRYPKCLIVFLTQFLKYLSKFVVNYKSRRMRSSFQLRTTKRNLKFLEDRRLNLKFLYIRARESAILRHVRATESAPPFSDLTKAAAAPALSSATTSSSQKRIKAPFVKYSFSLRNGFSRDKRNSDK